MDSLKRCWTAAAASKERWCILILSALAAVHVFVFSAAFPFFNVDEMYHFDLVVKYSRLDFPRKPEYVSEESLRYLVVYSTWEYTRTNDTLSAPPWKQPMSVMAPILISREIRWRSLLNYEATQPPLYYLFAGACWRLGEPLGFHDGFLLYLLHFLNMLVVGALVWAGWFAARLVFPGNLFVRIALPALLAFLPNRIFYSVNNDLLSPLCFGLTFVGLVKFLRDDLPSKRLAAATGLALAATFLSKSSNLPLLAVSAVVIALKIWTLFKKENVRASFTLLALLFLCSALPMAAWIVWCKINFGDFIGTSDIAHQLGWTVRPFSEWWHHPIFTPRGLWFFLSGNLQTLWQDEMLWYYQPLFLRPVNLFYSLASIVFILSALFCHKKAGIFQRRAVLFAFALVVAGFAFYGYLSIIYDFHNCFYPSRESPYFVSGRLILGALVPFLLLFVIGLDGALNKLGNAGKFFVLAMLLLFMLGTEIATDWPVFFSQYNWYDM